MARGSDEDDLPIRRTHAATLARLIGERLTRREALTGLLASGAGAALAGGPWGRDAQAATRNISTLTFRAPKHAIGDDHALAPGHAGQILIRWGDPVLPGAPAFDPARQSAADQARQFGY
ncbi:MAG: DUF839 domain-containing protein, partial [Alphaproteobacteria bacterium]|nr:DUF839 domain-containing protein [Alphaproteobacteria bacterium]